MEKTITIGDKEINMKVNANTPARYREEFGKDLIVELHKFMNHIDKSGNLTGDFDFGVVERLAYTMSKQGGSEAKNIDEFLDQFEGIDDVYLAMGDIIGLWTDSKKSSSVPKKKVNQ